MKAFQSLAFSDGEQEFLLREGDFYGSCLLDLFIFADAETYGESRYTAICWRSCNQLLDGVRQSAKRGRCIIGFGIGILRSCLCGCEERQHFIKYFGHRRDGGVVVKLRKDEMIHACREPKAGGQGIRAGGRHQSVQFRIVHFDASCTNSFSECLAVIHGLQIGADLVQLGGLFWRGVLEGGSYGRDFGIVLLENLLDATPGQQEDRLVQPIVIGECRNTKNSAETGSDKIETFRIHARA